MASTPYHVAILGLPEAAHSTVAGLSDVFGIFGLLAGFDDAIPAKPPFEVSIVGVNEEKAHRLPFRVDTTIDEVQQADIVIVPSLTVSPAKWRPGVRPEVVDWLSRSHASGARLCSACSGGLTLAETGLLDGGEATTHWAYGDTFRRYFPRTQLRLERLLIITGERRDVVMSGATGSWHDLALYLITQHVGLAAAQAIAKFLLLEWHADGQLPFVAFMPPWDHGDAVVRRAQEWLHAHLHQPKPVEEVMRRSGVAERTFKRRFARATGHSPIRYVQHLRVEAAKHHLEQSRNPVEDIAWAVGYEEPAAFRRLFKRLTGINPRDYRRKLQLPAYAAAGGEH